MPSERLHFRHIRHTSTFRLTLRLGFVTMAGIATLLALIYGLSARELDARSDHILRAEAARLSAVPPATLPSEIDGAIARSVSSLNFYGLLAPDGKQIAGNLRGRSGFTFGRPRELPARGGRHGPIRLLAMRTGSGGTILIGRDITPLVDLRWRVTEVLIFSGIAIVALIFFAAIALSLAPLRRVDRLQQIAHEIAAGELDVRMPILGRGDELDLFAGTVNIMVEEVGRVVSQVKAVTDAVAHDLRTPLTRVRNNLYRAGQHPDLDPILGERIAAAIADLDIVLERFAALLRISELEAGRRRAGFAILPLDPLIDTIVELYAPLAEERDIILSARRLPGIGLFGDEKLLFEAIGNLIDNAIKFTPAGGHIAITLSRCVDATCIEVQDDGPGIIEEQRKSVLRRFDRGNTSSEVEGSGLGLSVVAAILHLHRFTLQIDDAYPGVIARIIAADDLVPDGMR